MLVSLIVFFLGRLVDLSAKHHQHYSLHCLHWTMKDWTTRILGFHSVTYEDIKQWGFDTPCFQSNKDLGFAINHIDMGN